jgi:hypothetical protein
MTDLLRLHMIVKNESLRIRDTLESVKKCVDSWCILDTGSTDGTQDIIQEVMDGIPGQVIEKPIVTFKDTGIIDFAQTRNLGLELASFDTRFLLLLNGDDRLLDVTKLRHFCKEHEQESDGAYYLRVVGCTRGEYSSARLMRTSAGWRYSGATHEVLHGCGNVNINTNVRILHEEPSLENRKSRWEQDLVVLDRCLQDTPNDPRTVFYLAQTHECLGHYEEAVGLYKRRATLGSWVEEVYESLRRAGQCAEHAGRPWSESQQLYLDAYSALPERLESIYRIAQHWHDVDNHALAFFFSSFGLDSTVPDHSLMVDREVYEWRLADIASIHGYYLGKRKVGRQAALQAVKKGPGSENQRLRRNAAWYAPSTKELFPSFEEKKIELPFKDPWLGMNPSVCIVGGRRSCVVRGVNFEPVGCNQYHVRDADGVVRTQNWWVDFDKDYNIVFAKEIKDKTGRKTSKYPVCGFEDMRLFYWMGGYWATATICDMGPDTGSWEIGLLRINSDYDVDKIQLLRGPWSCWAQKNWRPFIQDDQLGWIYSSDPIHKILYIDGIAVSEGPIVSPPPILRGSSQAIQIPDGRWLWIDHEISVNGSGYDRIYMERFILADKNLNQVLKVGDLFHFHPSPGVEFCCGLALEGDTLITSHGSRDKTAMLGFISLNEVLASLQR